MPANNCVSDNKDEAFNSVTTIMAKQSIKIYFTGKEESDALELEELDKVVNDIIKDGKNHSVKV